MKKTLAGLLIAGTLALGSAKAGLYDNFSGESLDTNRWTESAFNGRTYPNSKGVDTTNSTYHIIQDTIDTDGREVVLTPQTSFQPGDKFQYDIKYNSGKGNNLYQVLVNGNYPETVPQTTPNPGSSTIGFWNGVPDTGNSPGVYHIKQEFFSNHISVTTTRPNGTQIQHSFVNVSAPYSIGLNIHTGDDGLMNFEVDNAYTNGLPAPAFTSIVKQGDKVSMTSSGIDDRQYILESSTNLTENIWNPVTNFVGSATIDAPLINLATEGNKFYKISDRFK